MLPVPRPKSIGCSKRPGKPLLPLASLRSKPRIRERLGFLVTTAPPILRRTCKPSQSQWDGLDSGIAKKTLVIADSSSKTFEEQRSNGSPDLGKIPSKVSASSLQNFSNIIVHRQINLRRRSLVPSPERRRTSPQFHEQIQTRHVEIQTRSRRRSGTSQSSGSG